MPGIIGMATEKVWKHKDFEWSYNKMTIRKYYIFVVCITHFKNICTVVTFLEIYLKCGWWKFLSNNYFNNFDVKCQASRSRAISHLYNDSSCGSVWVSRKCWHFAIGIAQTNSLLNTVVLIFFKAAGKKTCFVFDAHLYIKKKNIFLKCLYVSSTWLWFVILPTNNCPIRKLTEPYVLRSQIPWLNQ